MYTDDLVILCKSADDLQRAIDEQKIFCKQNHLPINQKKNKIMMSVKEKFQNMKSSQLKAKN